jgi:hypothetical protein
VQARCPQAGQLPRGPEEGRQDQPVQPGGALVPWAVHGGGSSAAWGIARTLPGGGTGGKEDCHCPHAPARPRELPWISRLGSPAPAAGHGRRSTGFGPPVRPSPGIGGEWRGPGGPAGGFLAPAGGWSSPGGTVGPVAARGPLGQPPLPDRVCAGLPSPVAESFASHQEQQIWQAHPSRVSSENLPNHLNNVQNLSPPSLLNSECDRSLKERFQHWAKACQTRDRTLPRCPRCHSPTPAGELERWQICSFCVSQQWH